jgi:hypothetical protein
MLRKSQIMIGAIALCVIGLLAVNAKTDNTFGLLSKESHAEKLWKKSGHADSSAEAFTHWDEDRQIPTVCAKCHSAPGFLDFLVDRNVDSPVAAGPGIENAIKCEVCHSDPGQGILREHSSVVFPSGVLVDDLGPEALCMECHQGRASKNTVDAAIAAAAVDGDTVSPDLAFINIHYYAAAANQFGTVVHAGYEYEGKSYDARFPHIRGYNACITCHNPHSLEIDLDACNTCHTGIHDPKDIRYYGSFMDYDGDRNRTEGMFYELETMKEKLYAAIIRYGRNVVRAPIVYDAHAYPYFFYDSNDNGLPDPEETNYGNRYTSFTPRLLRAVYNYQVAQKDPNAYAHGGKYIIQLLYDSLADLNTQFLKPINMAGMNRVDEGHFDGSAEAWRHWDEDGEVESFCAKCHSADGLATFLESGENVNTKTTNGLLCTSCHTTPPFLLSVDSVKFPSGAVIDMGDSSNICLNCHQGRASKSTVMDATTNSSGPWGFINIHYYPTAAVLFGTEVKGGFEFQGKKYAGQKLFANHNGLFDTCVECHMGTKSPHKPYDFTGEMHNVQKPNPQDCVYCHGQDVSQPNPGVNPETFQFSGIRPATIPDYDGDGNTKESSREEILGLEEALYAQIQTSAANAGTPIIYDGHSYPYFFKDLNANGMVDPGENIYPNLYLFTQKGLLKAAYNFQLSKKEPHGYIHNSRYIAQLLVDSIQHLGGDISSYTWRK